MNIIMISRIAVSNESSYSLKDLIMLTLAAFLIGIWFLGVMSSFTFGGFIHLLLVAAIIISLERMIEGGSLRGPEMRGAGEASA
jgi:hypothetical protein